MGERGDYSDNDLPPPLRLRAPPHLIALWAGVGALAAACGGTLLLLVLYRLL
jgi:hypothetical protein